MSELIKGDRYFLSTFPNVIFVTLSNEDCTGGYKVMEYCYEGKEKEKVFTTMATIDRDVIKIIN